MTTWDAKTAEWYATNYGEYATNRLAIDALEVAPDAVIVDVGCGTGPALRRVAPRVPLGTLIGIDPTPRMIEFARQRADDDENGHRIEFHVAPAEQLPLRDGVADIVLAFDSIDHWGDTSAGLGEVCRVLRPGGRLVIVKDGGLPDGDRSQKDLLDALSRTGLVIIEKRDLVEGDVGCTMWVCRRG